MLGDGGLTFAPGKPCNCEMQLLTIWIGVACVQTPVETLGTGSAKHSIAVLSFLNQRLPF